MESLWNIDEDTFKAFRAQEDPKQLETTLEKIGLSSMRDNQRAMVVFELLFQIIEFSSSRLELDHSG